MRTDEEREERAIWQLEEGRYGVVRTEIGYTVTAPDGTTSLVATLADLIAFANAVYHRVWTGQQITPSA